MFESVREFSASIGCVSSLTEPENRLTGLDESRVLARFDHAVARLAEANTSYSDDEIAADLVEATKTVRGRK